MPSGVGIFGGTFDPIHLGHLRAGEEIREAQGLDEIRFVPSASPPHKAGAFAGAADRLRMVELAVAGVPGFAASRVEVERAGRSYSVDTLRAVQAEIGSARRLVFVLGLDAFLDFHSWKEHTAIFALCDVVVMTRPPWPPTLRIEDFPVAARAAFRYDESSETFHHASGRRVILQRITALDVSASAIRARVAAGRSIRFLVPAAVDTYIAEHGLYRRGDTAS